MLAGIEVLEARVDRAQYGRYVISYKGSGYESEGRICILDFRSGLLYPLLGAWFDFFLVCVATSN